MIKKVFLVICLCFQFSCVSKSIKEEPVKVQESKSEVLNKDITFFSFDGVCWNKEQGTQELIENFTIQSASPDLIGIKQKEEFKFIPTTCFLEAKEKVIEVKHTEEKVDFECLFSDSIVVGSNYNTVENLSPTLVWLVSLNNGQNIVVPKNLCLFFPASAK